MSPNIGVGICSLGKLVLFYFLIISNGKIIITLPRFNSILYYHIFLSWVFLWHIYESILTYLWGVTGHYNQTVMFQYSKGMTSNYFLLIVIFNILIYPSTACTELSYLRWIISNWILRHDNKSPPNSFTYFFSFSL